MRTEVGIVRRVALRADTLQAASTGPARLRHTLHEYQNQMKPRWLGRGAHIYLRLFKTYPCIMQEESRGSC